MAADGWIPIMQWSMMERTALEAVMHMLFALKKQEELL
jgi:hypothetical protein